LALRAAALTKGAASNGEATNQTIPNLKSQFTVKIFSRDCFCRHARTAGTRQPLPLLICIGIMTTAERRYSHPPLRERLHPCHLRGLVAVAVGSLVDLNFRCREVIFHVHLFLSVAVILTVAAIVPAPYFIFISRKEK
jgi:hypothetical protein